MKIFLKIQSNTVFYMYLLSNNNIFSQKKIVYRSQRSYYNVRIGDLCVAECNTLRHFSLFYILYMANHCIIILYILPFKSVYFKFYRYFYRDYYRLFLYKMCLR